MSVSSQDLLRARVKSLDGMPAMPAVLGPLLRNLDLPADQIEIEKITELVATDQSLSAQCLRIANSSLFSRPGTIESIRGAVVALGARALRDILWSTFLLRMAPKGSWPLNPNAFWEHSLGCALVSQELARKTHMKDPSRAYLCGLLHDIGELVIASLMTTDFAATVKFAAATGMPLLDAEARHFGFTHCDTGKMLADSWRLPRDVCAVIEFHHTPELAPPGSPLVALVHISDWLCRLCGMGYGYHEFSEIDLQQSAAWAILARQLPEVSDLDFARFTLELADDVDAVQKLVSTIFQNS